MRRRTAFGHALLVGVIGAGIAPAGAAGPWTFDPPVAVTEAAGPNVFHHLESSGRSNVAVSGDLVAVAWEDNRDGTARIRVAFRALGEGPFGGERVASGPVAAYEPVIAALEAGRFVLGWEEDGAVWARTLDRDVLDPPRRLSAGAAGQIHIGVSERGEVQAVWSERAGGAARIVTAALEPAVGKAIGRGVVRNVDPVAPGGDQQYPVVAWPRTARLVFIWEDRRHGHTVLLWSQGPKGGPFSAPRQLNETVRQQSTYGRGTGVARPVVAVFGPGRVAAAWLDKRDFAGGYDVYAALSVDEGRSFGRNQKVQDSFGDAFGQWHAAIAGHRAGELAVVWDDDRDETADLWFSRRQAGGWNENQPVPGAFGPGQQRSPAVALDEAGDIHLAWVEQHDAGTRLRYTFGRRAPAGAGR